MDKIALLASRKKQAEEQNASALSFAAAILDEASFVETDSFYFAGNDLVDNGTLFGEGVVSGSGTIGGIPVCLFVQNFDVMKGGLSKGQADKILKCMDNAESAGIPLLCVLHTAGARLGEGIRVLDGYARVLKRLAQLSGSIPLITVVKGEVYGAFSAFAGLSDFVFVMKEGVLATTSPAILTAKADKDPSKEFFAAKSLCKRGIASRVCKDTAALKSDLAKFLDLLAGGELELSEAELNRTAISLNKGYKAESVITRVFDAGSFFELEEDAATEVRVGFARLGGFRVATAVCSDDAKEITALGCRKITKLLNYCDVNEIPFVIFVNSNGFTAELSDEDRMLGCQAELYSALALSDNLLISVVTGIAAGSVYSAFVSKEMTSYSYAWATASVSLLSNGQGAELVYADEIKKAKNRDKARAAAAEKYAEVEGDVFAAVQSGSIDEIIEPSLTRQYLLSVLMQAE